MKISDIGFLKTKPNRPQNSKTENLVSAIRFKKTDILSFGTVFHVVSFTIHLPTWWISFWSRLVTHFYTSTKVLNGEMVHFNDLWTKFKQIHLANLGGSPKILGWRSIIPSFSSSIDDNVSSHACCGRTPSGICASLRDVINGRFCWTTLEVSDHDNKTHTDTHSCFIH